MNSFGTIYRTHVFGESHGNLIGVLIDGCPAGIPLAIDDFKEDLSRRKAGASATTSRIEDDIPLIQSGVFNGFTTGAPICIVFENKNIQSKDYDQLKIQPRPGHADFVAQQKFHGFNDHRGGGHFSGRLTLSLVAAGVIAKKIHTGIEVTAKLIEAGGNKNIEEAVALAIKNQDSIGGIVECIVTGLPVGLGEPFFNSVESLISHAVFSIPAIKGIEFGSGFSSARMTGSNHNDSIIDASGKTKTNFAGGINGGITNGNELIFRVAVKPPSSTPQPQQTLNMESGRVEELMVVGRHDLCIALRVPVVVESAVAMVLADLLLVDQIQRQNRSRS
ncbi:MAG: chorismate synthase [Bacteroidetes bacterium]|nr:chorismate synthase [Bacteroidota bacterium]